VVFRELENVEECLQPVNGSRSGTRYEVRIDSEHVVILHRRERSPFGVESEQALFLRKNIRRHNDDPGVFADDRLAAVQGEGEGGGCRQIEGTGTLENFVQERVFSDRDQGV
jgi:hypothetical protein